MAGYPIADKEAARILGAALRRIGYSEAAVVRLLGEEAYSRTREDLPVDERRLPQTRLGTVIRALFLQSTVPTSDAVRALGQPAVEALERTGLAELGNTVRPQVRIVPVGELFVASDDYTSGDEQDPPDYVAAYTPTSRLCDLLTPRPRVSRALDVGTGSGIQALVAASHTDTVIATDINARALAYTELNAALNGLTNIECRQGNLYEPVQGERFDLITCNAPYVVSPEQRWAYRDGGLQADEISERLVRGAAGHLAETGFATLLVSWIARDQKAPDEHPLAWTSGAACDSWILPVWESDPLDHAARWNDQLALKPARFAQALDSWTDYLTRLGVRWLTEGAVLLHRRPGTRHRARVDPIDEDTLEASSSQIQRAFRSRTRLAELRRPSQLLEARLALAATVRIVHDLAPNRGKTTVRSALLELAEGTGATLRATPRVLELVTHLDGTAPLSETIMATATRLGLPKMETTRLRQQALKASRELLELGALEFR